MTTKKTVATLAALAILATPVLANAQTSFTDVSSNDWYSATVNEMASVGLVKGRDSSHFAPNAYITRAEFAQLIYNILGKPTVSQSSGFSDVQSGDWFANAVSYAKSQGIAKGIDATHFNPNANITRQEVAKMAWNVFGAMDQSGKNLPKRFSNQIQPKEINAQMFKDESNFASWAHFEIDELATAKVINGYQDGSFQPGQPITRAEAAKILDGALHQVGYQFAQASSGDSSSSSTLKDNGDGTQSPANAAIPSTYTDAQFQVASKDEITKLMQQVKIQTNGQNVTVTLPDTNNSNVEWYVKAINTSYKGLMPYESAKGMTVTYTNASAVTIALRQPPTIGDAGYLTAYYLYKNGQWTLQYS